MELSNLPIIESSYGTNYPHMSGHHSQSFFLNLVAKIFFNVMKEVAGLENSRARAPGTTTFYPRTTNLYQVKSRRATTARVGTCGASNIGQPHLSLGNHFCIPDCPLGNQALNKFFKPWLITHQHLFIPGYKCGVENLLWW